MTPARAFPRTLPLALVLVSCSGVAVGSCGGETADTVLIVDQEGVGVRGQVEIRMTPAGTFEPHVWRPGTIVVFRVADTLRGEAGEAGMAYRITDDEGLAAIGRVDLAKSDDEIAAGFGIPIESPTPD